MADQYTLISTWTRFRVPLEENIFDIDDGSDCGKKWIEIVRPLVKAPGHMESHWGRLVEDPAQVMLVSIWKNRSLLANFKASPSHDKYVSGISTSSPPAEITVDFGNVMWYCHVGRQTAVTTVYFASPPTASQRAKIEGMRGLHYSYAYGFANQHRYLSRGHPVKGWIDGPQSWDGEDLKAMIWCHFWKGAEEENKFRETETIIPVGRPIEETVTVLQLWERELKEAGAVGWTEQHYNFALVPSAFQGEPWEP